MPASAPATSSTFSPKRLHEIAGNGGKTPGGVQESKLRPFLRISGALNRHRLAAWALMSVELLENYQDDQGNPAGGIARGPGFVIEWQNGPLAVDGERREQNGAFVEDLLTVCLRRLEFYNSTRFKCRENSLAITHIEEAVHWLQHRTANRVARGVEGTLEE